MEHGACAVAPPPRAIRILFPGLRFVFGSVSCGFPRASSPCDRSGGGVGSQEPSVPTEQMQSSLPISRSGHGRPQPRASTPFEERRSMALAPPPLAMRFVPIRRVSYVESTRSLWATAVRLFDHWRLGPSRPRLACASRRGLVIALPSIRVRGWIWVLGAKDASGAGCVPLFFSGRAGACYTSPCIIRAQVWRQSLKSHLNLL
jgi:hypothetical protein